LSPRSIGAFPFRFETWGLGLRTKERSQDLVEAHGILDEVQDDSAVSDSDALLTAEYGFERRQPFRDMLVRNADRMADSRGRQGITCVVETCQRQVHFHALVVRLDDDVGSPVLPRRRGGDCDLRIRAAPSAAVTLIVADVPIVGPRVLDPSAASGAEA